MITKVGLGLVAALLAATPAAAQFSYPGATEQTLSKLEKEVSRLKTDMSVLQYEVDKQQQELSFLRSRTSFQEIELGKVRCQQSNKDNSSAYILC